MSTLNFAVTNVVNNNREIILFHRIGRELKQFHDHSFYPYFYNLDERGAFKTIDNKKVSRIQCSRPSDVSKQRIDASYEADILFTKRYLIDRVGQFLPCELKYSFIDIEVVCPEMPSYLNPIYPISCISCSNSYNSEIKTFFINDYGSEEEMLDELIKWIKEQQFDFLAGWNMMFDWRYLTARYKYLNGTELSDLLSPIFRSRYLGNKDNNVLIPAGLGIVDYLDWYKKIYKEKSSYTLDDVAQDELKEVAYEKVDFNQVSEDIKRKNINDVIRLVKIEKAKHLVNHYDELRRMSKSDFIDVTWNSKIIDMMLLSEAKYKNIILPSKKYAKIDEEEEEEILEQESFKGAYRRCDILDENKKIITKLTGYYKNIWKLDLSSAYPMSIINFCLDVSNISEFDGVEINGTKFNQNSNALLPCLAKKLISKKDELKNQLKSADPESDIGKDLQTKYDATKAVVNSLFGVCGLKIFRIFDLRVASAITYIVRDLLHYVEDKLQERGMRVIYLDTDSVFVEAKENPGELCNNLVKQWVKEKYNRTEIGIEFDCEGIFEKLLIIALCHYKGILKTTKGKIKEEIKGIEVKRKDSSKFMKVFYNNLINKIMNEESQESIVKYVNQEIERIKTLPLLDIGFPCRLKTDKVYDSPPIFTRGLEYTNELIKFNKVPGEMFYWIYIKPFGKAIRKSTRKLLNKETGKKERVTTEKEVDKDVLCFDNDNQAHIKDIDWEEMIKRSIYNKVEIIFDALSWDLSQVMPVKVKKERKKKEITQEEAIKELKKRGLI
jgi:DNA polymerase elongation subunit (family B)